MRNKQKINIRTGYKGFSGIKNIKRKQYYNHKISFSNKIIIT